MAAFIHLSCLPIRSLHSCHIEGASTPSLNVGIAIFAAHSVVCANTRAALNLETSKRSAAGTGGRGRDGGDAAGTAGTSQGWRDAAGTRGRENSSVELLKITAWGLTGDETRCEPR